MSFVKNILLLLLLLPVYDCSAQLCQGSLGDPVINITFGRGANPGNPLAAATTTYFFVSTSCPNDGMYTVANSTSNCFGNTWHTLTQDHTGDGSGYMMLVNATYEPGDFYVDTVHGLCSNTTYEFAAWIVNILKPDACNGSGIKPNLTFSIETTSGTILQTQKTGDIPDNISPVWKQYSLSFATPGGVNDVVVRLRNNAPGGCGNDIAIDDITFRPCGPQVTASIEGANAATSVNVCDDDKTVYTLKGNVSAGYATPAYQWQTSNDSINWTDIPNAVTATFNRQPTSAGTYYYRLAVADAGNITSSLCRIASNNISFHVNTKPVISVSSNSPVCEGTTLSLTANGGSIYQWQGPNNYNSSASPATINNVTIAAAGKYFVMATLNGCSQKDSLVVSVKPKPNANAGADVGICEGNSVTLNASGGNIFSWQPSTGLSATNISNPVASPVDSTAYIVTVTDSISNCSANDTVLVNVFQKPTASAGADKTIIEGDKAILNGSATGGGINYYWTPDVFMNNANSLQPVVSPPRDTTYTLHVESTAGCGIATDDVFVKVFKKVIVPNAFSPNKDGINDTWQLLAIDAYPDAEINVFNRYGQVVFTSHGYNKPWDGTYNNKLLPVGTYYYVINLKFGLPKLKGWVAILR